MNGANCNELNRKVCGFLARGLLNTTSLVLIATLFAMPTLAQTVTTVASFPGGNASEYPGGTPAQGRDGKLYGTAFGTTYGSIFRVTTTGLITQLYAFDGTSAINPYSGLTLATDGNFYGTSSFGGSDNGGVLFKVSPGGAYSDLYEFTNGSLDDRPEAPPILASDTNLYGTAFETVYRYSPQPGTFDTLVTFSNGEITGLSDPLLQGSNRNLYGTGNGLGADNCGGIFEISLTGTLLNDYSFSCRIQGDPGGPLIQANDGNYYGLSSTGGAFDLGTIFRLNQRGKVTVLHNFQGGPSDGVGGILGMVEGTDGFLYGITQDGGTNGTGIIFQISTNGAYSVLYSFPPSTAGPFALLQHTNGKFYGFDSVAGTSGYGTLFSLDMGLGPFVTFVQHFGRSGQTVQIFGQGLTGATSVTFNGVPATSFKVAADTFMNAIIPSGATTGPVVVTTQTGLLTSNISFRILQ